MNPSFATFIRFCSFLAIATSIFSCELTEEKLTTDSSVNLTFSTDTVFFDTVFTSIGSITKRLKVYNPNKNAVEIEQIGLGNTLNSPYSLIINGRESNELDKVRLLGEDSLFVLVKVKIDPINQNMPFVVRDSVTFRTNGNLQDIKLIAWGQDANFLRDSVIDCNTTWNSEKPYVIFNNVLVDSACSLTILEGTKIYLNPGSNFLVEGKLEVLGKPDNMVIFQSARLDPPFDQALGQWGGIVFTGNSRGNLIEGARIKNGTFGIFADPSSDPTKRAEITIRQTIIENMAFSGVACFRADLTMENSRISNCIERTIFCVAGGNYTFEHNTFANYSFTFFRENPQIVLGNFVILEEESGERLIEGDLNVRMANNIVWGNLQEEFELPEPLPTSLANFDFQNNIFKTQLSTLDINGNLINTDPLFIEPRESNFSLDTLSPAQNTGLQLNYIFDLKGQSRDSQPDLGALERID
jgi:hypothetical protein